MKRRAIILGGILAAQFLVATTLGATVTYALENGKAPQGVKALGVDLAGLTREEAWNKIEARLPSSLEWKGQTFPLNLVQTKSGWNKWLDLIYEQNSGNWLNDTLLLFERLGRNPAESPPRLDEAEILPQLEQIKKKVERPPIPGRITYQGSKLVRQEGQDGQTLDQDGTWQALQNGQGVVALKLKSVSPKPSHDDLTQIKDALGDYTTFFDPRDSSRTTNVRLAARALDGVLLAPGAKFSFNNVVGERTELAGYLPAFVFVNQEVVKDDGGGVCQDSSTLYQAVKQARLEIIERHTHTLPVAYVPKGQDATVAYGILDFGFRNNTQGYLLISARTGDNWMRIRLFGIADGEHPALLKPGGFPENPKDWNSEIK